MSKKFAVFVEGFTEQEFTIKLLTDLAGNHGLTFEVHLQHKGKLSFSELRSHQSPTIHVLVANCCTDGQVKPQIIDRYKLLKSAGYTLIIGLRDVYPLTHNDIQQLENNLSFGLPVGSVPIHMHLSIMEIEAWFLEEITHFERIDEKITKSELITNRFDPKNSYAFNLPHPSQTLNKIYQSVGKAYNKNKRQVQRTVDALSYEELYINVRQKAPSLNKFITSLETGIFSK